MTIRRTFILWLVLAVVSARNPRAQSPTDDITPFLASLEHALASGNVDLVRALESTDLPAEGATLAAGVENPRPTSVAVRERSRRTTAAGATIVADVFIAHERAARLVTWRLTLTRSSADAPLRIAALDEQTALDDLVNLSIDFTHEYAVRDLTISGPDLVLTLRSGTAFTAGSSRGLTTLVWHGRGEIHFTPSAPAEQGQLKLFAGRTDFQSDVQDMFLRVSPDEFASRVSSHSLTPVAVDADAAARARGLFDRFAADTYTVDLRNFGQTGWSIDPPPGSVVAAFKTSRHGWLTYARAPDDPEDVTLDSPASNRLISSYESPEHLAARTSSDDRDRANYEIEHHDLEVTFDPDTGALRGHDTILIRTHADRLGSVALHLDEGLAIEAVSSPGFDRLLPVRVTGQPRVLVILPGPVKAETEFVLDVDYAGHLVPPDLDREALNEQTPTGQGLPDPAATFRPNPEPVWVYSGRAAWYPEGETTGHATATLRVTAPAQYAIAASGSFVRSTLAPDDAGRPMRSNDYVADRPVRYLACAISRLVAVGRTTAKVPKIAPASDDPPAASDESGAAVNVSVVATPREAGSNRTLAARTAAMLQFYARLIGEAPYPDDTIVAVDDNLPGGHSPAYLTILRERLPTSPYAWRDDPVAFDRYPDFLLAHEIAHQWWGQAVGWTTYHDQWLSEGLAQYFAVLDLRSTSGAETAHDILAAMCASTRQSATKGPIALGYRLGRVDNDPVAFRVTLYNKSAVVLDMLRRLVGDQAFFAGLRRFYQTQRFRDASTDDFRAAMEAETPIRLARFFNQWIDGTSMPRLRVTTTVDSTGRSLTVHVTQLADVIDVPVTVRIAYVDGPPDEVTIAVTDREVDRQIPLRGRVRHVATRDDVTLVDYAG